MTSEPRAHCETVRWKNHQATRLSNGVVELTLLTSGGHLAEFRFLNKDQSLCQNVLWEAPWLTFDAAESEGRNLSAAYGPVEVRKFLAGYTGHSLCLDYFGGPSAEQAAAGLSLHGEAPNARWNLEPGKEEEAFARWSVDLPSAQLTFEREIRLGAGESVAFVQETVSNHSGVEHVFDWVQHVTLGAPLLKAGESTLYASASRGVTSPLSYDGGCLLANDREFTWPHAPLQNGKGLADLQAAFAYDGLGFIAGVQLDPGRAQEYFLAVNWKQRLGVGYCFRRKDFPWMTVWEENHARLDTPWNGSTQARGMEFGTTPLPLGREETMRRGPLFDTPHQCVLAAGERKSARYLIFVFELPAGVDSIENVTASEDAIVLSGPAGLSIPATGCGAFLA